MGQELVYGSDIEPLRVGGERVLSLGERKDLHRESVFAAYSNFFP